MQVPIARDLLADEAEVLMVRGTALLEEPERVSEGPTLLFESPPTRSVGYLPFLLECEVLPGTLSRIDEALTHATMADVSPPPTRP